MCLSARPRAQAFKKLFLYKLSSFKASYNDVAPETKYF